MSNFLENLKRQINDERGRQHGMKAGWINVSRVDLFQLIEHFERLDNEARERYARDTNISLAEVKTRELEEWQCSDGTGSGSFNDYSRDGLRKQDSAPSTSGDLCGSGTSESLQWPRR